VEAKEELRKLYLEKITNIKLEQIVYIDESGVDQNCYKERGWARRGKPFIAKRSGKRIKRTNIIAGLRGREIIAPLIFQESCDSAVFIQWIEDCLIKHLLPGQVVVMDNATFHKSKKVKELIESAHCQLLYLPPYSPDLNPIEKFWANMKRWIKQHFDSIHDSFNAVIQFFKCQSST